MAKTLVGTAFLMSFALVCMAARSHAARANSTQLTSVQDATRFEKSPACPNRPLYVRPTEADIRTTGLTLEVLCIITDTPLERDRPSPRESPDLLRRYLEQPPYSGLTDQGYLAIMGEAVQLWPQSRFSHAGLARALLRGRREPTREEQRRAASEYVQASRIAFAEGKVRHVLELSDLLGDLRDRSSIDWYLTRALGLTPRDQDRYVIYLRFGRALGKAGDDRAGAYLRKAIEIRPNGTWEAYEFYATALLELGRPHDVVSLLSPEFQRRQIVPDRWFHGMRCRALLRMGRQTEADTECAKAR